MVDTTGLVSYYKCDTNGSFPDAHGSSPGTASTFAYNASGKINGGYKSTGGTAGDIDLGLGAVSSTHDYTWSMWVYDEGADDNLVHYLMYLRGTYGIIQLGIGMDGASNPNILTARAYSAGSYYYVYYGGASPSAPPKNQWYHVVFTVEEGVAVKIYVNGVLEDTNSGYGTHQSFSSVGYTFGGSPSSAQSHDGTIDEIGYWDVALTQQDVTDLYNSGDGLAYPFTGGGVTLSNSIDFGNNF